MLARAVEAGVPAGWVTADEVYGGDARLRVFMEDRDLAYVLAVKATQPLWVAGEQGPAEVQRASWSLACPPAPGGG
jgi:SRSO17 transposase